MFQNKLCMNSYTHTKGKEKNHRKKESGRDRVER